MDDSTDAYPRVVTGDGTSSPQWRGETGVDVVAAQLLAMAEELLEMIDSDSF